MIRCWGNDIHTLNYSQMTMNYKAWNTEFTRIELVCHTGNDDNMLRPYAMMMIPTVSTFFHQYKKEKKKKWNKMKL